MNNFPSIPSESQEPWTPAEIVEVAEPEQERGLIHWWYRITAPPRPSAKASYVKREADRKARLFSSVAFFFLVTMVLFFPASFFMPMITPLAVVFAAASSVIALIVNRTGHTMTAGVITVLGAETALTGVILAIRPLLPVDVQLYDLYVIIILLAVSLLPARFIFVFALVHSIFIGVDMYIHPHTLALAQDLETQFIPAIVRPIGLQLIVAGVAYIWVQSTTRASERANRAEMVAALEHTISEQRAFFEREKQELEESIKQLIQAHVDAANGQLMSRVSYPPAKALWPLVGAMNSQWSRLQHSQQIEQELQLLRQAIAYYIELIQKHGTRAGQPSLPFVRTGTSLDQLMLAMKALYSASRSQDSAPGWYSQQSRSMHGE